MKNSQWLAAAVIGVLLAPGAGAQDVEKWRRVMEVSPGSAVKVMTFDGVEHKGTLASVDAEYVRVREKKGQETSTSRTDVKRVEVKRGSKRVRNIALGAGIGVAVGIVAAFASCPSCKGETSSDEFNRRLALGGVAGAGVGAGVGALGAGYSAVYKAKRPKRP